MKTFKRIEKVNGKDVACGCEFTEGPGRERWIRMCMEHETESITRHAAAILSCSHANRDLVGNDF